MRSLDLRAWLARHELAADAALTLLVLAVTVLPLLRQGSQVASCGCEPVPWWGWLLVAAECLPLVWRRRRPWAVAITVGLLTSAHGLTAVPDPPIAFAAVAALYALAAHGTRQEAVVGAGLATVLLGSVLYADRASDLQDVAINYLILATAWLLGDSARSRRERAAELEERVAQAERARVAEADRAVVEERARIAREMHDVVAHHVSMMVVQAEAGPVVVHRDPDRASQAFDAISTTGREALIEMRRLLGVLRTDRSSDLAPQPGLAALPALAERCRAAGLPVQLYVDDDGGPLPVGVALSAHRIVQESLTNALRHAGPATAEVTVRRTHDAVEVLVHDDGLGGRPGGDHGGNDESGDDRPGGRLPGGNGLVGMRERALSHGGQLTAGPDPRGGWTVTARLPLSPVTTP